MTARLPTLFLSHGSPLTALEPGAAGAAWARLAQALPRPRAVLVASAHWDTALPMVSGAAKLRTIHDFAGFPDELYELRYDVDGAPEVARGVAESLKAAGITAGIDGCRGIDHGAWVPLRWMYPRADVPVVQLSVQTGRGLEHHFRLGAALASLARDGVLIVGSGHATHNLADWARHAGSGEPLRYAARFADWLDERLTAHDLDSVLDYRRAGPEGARAHPSEEHFVPLLVAWGAAGRQARAERVHRGIEGGALAMDAYLFRGAVR